MDIITAHSLNISLQARLEKETWSVEDAINILATIQFYKQGGFPDLGSIGKIQEQCAQFIHMGFQCHKLHIVDNTSSKNRFSNIASGVASGIGLGSILGGSSGGLGAGIVAGAGAGLAAPVLLTGGLIAATALNFLPSKRKKQDFLRSQLIPAEVVKYAKSKGKWFDPGEVESSTDIHPSAALQLEGIAENTAIEPGILPHPVKKPSKAKKGNKSNQPGRINTETAKSMGDKLWGPLREMKNHVTNFVEEEAAKELCTCLPRHMLRIVINLEKSSGKRLIDTNILSEDATLVHIKKIFSANKFSRAQKRGGPTPKNTCPLHAVQKTPKG